MFKLIGSQTSPYVRRLRLWLATTPYEFVNLDIYSPEGRAELEKYNPAMKIPMLQDGEQAVFDSRAIYRYLCEQLDHEQLTVDQENALTLIDAAIDANILLMYSKRSGLDPQGDCLICNLQRERLAKTLPVLERQVEEGAFDQWHYPAMSLFGLLDWASFRELMDLTDWPALNGFYQSRAQQPMVKETDPRLA